MNTILEDSGDKILKLTMVSSNSAKTLQPLIPRKVLCEVTLGHHFRNLITDLGEISSPTKIN